jgi:putative redox protein
MRELNLDWNPKSPLLFEAEGDNGKKMQMDGTVAAGGEGKAFSPKQMLMFSLAGCTGIDVLGILRKMRQEVTGYRLIIKGWEEEEWPKAFTKLVVEHVVSGPNLSQESVDRAVKLSHEKYCGVSASLENPVEVEMFGRIATADELAGIK